MGDLSGVPGHAKRLESLGYHGAVTAETSHDPFFPLLLAAQETQDIELVTSIALAFSRTPMNLANIGHDLNSFSKGRFVLGLGSQIRPHITKRFSMPWSKPAARMREFISAMHAIWDCWHNGTRLSFEGDFYTHSLMTPMFTPLDTEYGAPKVFLAAVGPLMTEVAGEVADGVIIHAFTTTSSTETPLKGSHPESQENAHWQHSVLGSPCGAAPPRGPLHLTRAHVAAASEG
jgi:probable F420-dependent oxidoreductase